jgi:hypothetical protein
VTDTDDFDLAKQAVDVPTKTVTPRRIVKRRQSFVRVPLAASEVLAKTARDKTYPVYHHLLYESWRAGGRPVKLANGFLERVGIDRFAKKRALEQLERVGLVKVDWRDRKSPIVTVLG